MSRRYPGWYPDPADPALLRHWDGRCWDGQRRHLPAWSISTEELSYRRSTEPSAQPPTDGPVRSPPPPAVTTSLARGSTGRRLVVPSASWRPPGPPPRSGPDPLPSPSPRRRWLLTPRRFAALLAVMTLVAVTASSSVAARPRHPAGALSADTALLREANAACVATLGALRPLTSSASPGSTPTAGGGAGTAGAVATPAAVSAARRELAGLSRRLVDLAGPPRVAGTLGGWLRLWERWGTARASQARAQAAGRSSEAAGDARAAQADARRADSFAVGHGLRDCTLRAQPTSGLVAIP